MELHDYQICDWVGDVDYRPLTYYGPVKERTKILKLFMERKPFAIQELQKLVPHIKLDYSYESLQALDACLIAELEKDVNDNPDEFLKRPNLVIEGYRPTNNYTAFNSLPPLWRSILSDAFVYLAEMSLQAVHRDYPLMAKTVGWYVFNGKRDSDSGGFPGLGCAVPKSKEKLWSPNKCAFFHITLGSLYATTTLYCHKDIRETYHPLFLSERLRISMSECKEVWETHSKLYA
jgi:hypothetical protein